jgi:hypothetical protein
MTIEILTLRASEEVDEILSEPHTLPREEIDAHSLRIHLRIFFEAAGHQLPS